jgi:hypothetical protein
MFEDPEGNHVFDLYDHEDNKTRLNKLGRVILRPIDAEVMDKKAIEMLIA